MTAPVPQLLSSIETLLTTGSGWISEGLFDADWIYRGEALVEVTPPMVIIAQAGPAKERHVQGIGLWEIPVTVRYIMSRNGDDGDTPTDVEDAFRAYGDDLEGFLTLPLLIDPDDVDAGQSTPEERMSDDDIHVWEISDVEVNSDTELEGDPVAEVTFTAFCCHASKLT